jgi:menaquinone-dependent protoporphyrinogen oxidase
VLVTFASRTGSTAGVAAAIGGALAGQGALVDVRPMTAVSDLSKYQAVVAGSAIQNKQWLPEAVEFVRQNRAELAQKPFAVFLVCMTLAMHDGEKYRPLVADFMAPVRALIRPVSQGLFAGTLDIGKVPRLPDRLMFRLSVALGVWSEGDHRDWAAIRAWAETLGPLLAGAP